MKVGPSLPTGAQIGALGASEDSKNGNANRIYDEGLLKNVPKGDLFSYAKRALRELLGGDVQPRLTGTPISSTEEAQSLIRARLLETIEQLGSGDIPADPETVQIATAAQDMITRALTQHGIDLPPSTDPWSQYHALDNADPKLVEAAFAEVFPLFSAAPITRIENPEAFLLATISESIVNSKSSGRPVSVRNFAEGFVRADTTLDYKALARAGVDKDLAIQESMALTPREMFFRTLAPLADEPSGKVVVLPPGYTEDSDNMLELAETARKRGDYVIVCDMEFEGKGDTQSGKFLSLARIARDIAHLAATEGARVLEGPLSKHANKEIILAGNSTTGGASILAAQMLKAGALIKDGAPIPMTDLTVAPMSPYLGPSDDYGVTKLMNKAAHLKFLNPITSAKLVAGNPLLPMATEEAGKQKMLQAAVVNNHHSRIDSFRAFDTGLEMLWSMADNGVLPTKLVTTIDDEDKVASSRRVHDLAAMMGGKAHVFSAGADGSHSLVQTEKGQRLFEKMLERID